MSAVTGAEAKIRAIAEKRIIVLDGAMGTAIQALRLSEDEFRGARFADWPRDVRGNNDLLNLTRPEDIGAIHRTYLDAGADIVEFEHFLVDDHRPGRLRHGGTGLRAQRGGGADRQGRG